MKNMILSIRNEYFFKCNKCNKKYFVYKEDTRYVNRTFNTCSDYITLVLPDCLKSVQFSGCQLLSLFYNTKRKCDQQPFSLSIDPFEFTYVYTKALSKKTGLDLSLKYNNDNDYDFAVLINCLYINSDKSIE